MIQATHWELFPENSRAHAPPCTQNMLGTHPHRACEVNHSILLMRAGKHTEKYRASAAPLQEIIQGTTPVQRHSTYYSALKITVLGEHVHSLSKEGNPVLPKSHFLIISSFVVSFILSCIPQCFYSDCSFYLVVFLFFSFV